MSNHNNIVIIISTINTTYGKFTVPERFHQTLKTIMSVRNNIPDAYIIFIDNSSRPIHNDHKSIINQYVDIMELMEPNLFTIYSNGINSKGLGEAFTMYRALQIIKDNNISSNRIFKISARYNLTDTFNLKEYDDYKHKYTFKINPWDVSDDNWITRKTVIYFETRLWSFCSSLLLEIMGLLPHILHNMLTQTGNYEQSLHRLIPHNKVIELNEAHIEGITADTGVYKYE
jgi:hypothetical protein